MYPRNIVVSKRSQKQRLHTVWFHLHNIKKRWNFSIWQGVGVEEGDCIQNTGKPIRVTEILSILIVIELIELVNFTGCKLYLKYLLKEKHNIEKRYLKILKIVSMINILSRYYFLTEKYTSCDTISV